MLIDVNWNKYYNRLTIWCSFLTLETSIEWCSTCTESLNDTWPVKGLEIDIESYITTEFNERTTSMKSFGRGIEPSKVEP